MADQPLDPEKTAPTSSREKFVSGNASDFESRLKHADDSDSSDEEDSEVSDFRRRSNSDPQGLPRAMEDFHVYNQVSGMDARLS